MDSSLALESGALTILLPTGALQPIPVSQIKAICWVRDWTDARPWSRSQYSVRPRQQGLWVRLIFQDGEELEATMPNSLSALDPMALSITPPELSPGIQRVQVPRSAIHGFEILGVIGSPLSKPRKAAATAAQLKMFD